MLRFPRFSQTKYAETPLSAPSYARARSPPSGRSILMTSAPMSASWREQNGAATACSIATTRMPLSGRQDCDSELDVAIHLFPCEMTHFKKTAAFQERAPRD